MSKWKGASGYTWAMLEARHVLVELQASRYRFLDKDTYIRNEANNRRRSRRRKAAQIRDARKFRETTEAITENSKRKTRPTNGAGRGRGGGGAAMVVAAVVAVLLYCI
eukprot:Filipodium_phascolosomae@DN2630_c0_g1_i3.p2